MNDITEILRNLLDQFATPSEADKAFLDMLKHDEILAEDYKVWCEANGYDEDSGYADCIDEMMSSRDTIWEQLDE